MVWNNAPLGGSFTADGAIKTLSIRSNVDWIWVHNLTAINQATADLAASFYWQRGMTNGRGLVWTKLGAVANDPMTAGQLAANSGFLTVDTSGSPLSSAVTVTAATDATEPVFSTATTTNLVSGSIVRLYGFDEQVNLNGMDFAIDTVVASTSFKMAAPLATTPGAAEVTGGSYRIVQWDPVYYPRWRYIANITQATSAVVTVTVPSGYTVGQKVRVIVPTTSQSGTSDYGMVEINNMVGTVTAVNDTVGTQTVTLDIDSSGFTAFTFPTAAKAAVALRHAMLVPAGMDTAQAISSSVSTLAGAEDNRSVLGVRLLNPQGASTSAGPAGGTGDVLYWAAGSFAINNNE